MTLTFVEQRLCHDNAQEKGESQNHHHHFDAHGAAAVLLPRESGEAKHGGEVQLERVRSEGGVCWRGAGRWLCGSVVRVAFRSTLCV